LPHSFCSTESDLLEKSAWIARMEQLVCRLSNPCVKFAGRGRWGLPVLFLPGASGPQDDAEFQGDESHQYDGDGGDCEREGSTDGEVQ
jgi:hypothetical protein